MCYFDDVDGDTVYMASDEVTEGLKRNSVLMDVIETEIDYCCAWNGLKNERIREISGYEQIYEKTKTVLYAGHSCDCGLSDCNNRRTDPERKPVRDEYSIRI